MALSNKPLKWKDSKQLVNSLRTLGTEPALMHVRNLSRTELDGLLLVGLGHTDIERQRRFDRCRQLQAKPTGYLDLGPKSLLRHIMLCCQTDKIVGPHSLQRSCFTVLLPTGPSPSHRSLCMHLLGPGRHGKAL